MMMKRVWKSSYQFVLILTTILGRNRWFSSAFSNGAGGCNAGDPVEGSHFTRSRNLTGSLFDNGFQVRLNGYDLSSERLAQIYVGTDYKIELNALAEGTFLRGFLIRLGKDENALATLLPLSGDNSTQIETSCTESGVAGITHTKSVDKKNIAGLLRIDSHVDDLPLDITVVVQNNVNISEWYYSRFTLSTLDPPTLSIIDSPNFNESDPLVHDASDPSPRIVMLSTAPSFPSSSPSEAPSTTAPSTVPRPSPSEMPSIRTMPPIFSAPVNYAYTGLSESTSTDEPLDPPSSVNSDQSGVVMPTTAPSIRTMPPIFTSPVNYAYTGTSADEPSNLPTNAPSFIPAAPPPLTDEPSYSPSEKPSTMPSPQPTRIASEQPSVSPTGMPSLLTDEPSYSPSDKPSTTPSPQPTRIVSEQPSVSPTVVPTQSPTQSKISTMTEGPVTMIPTVTEPTACPTIKHWPCRVHSNWNGGKCYRKHVVKGEKGGTKEMKYKVVKKKKVMKLKSKKKNGYKDKKLKKSVKGNKSSTKRNQGKKANGSNFAIMPEKTTPSTPVGGYDKMGSITGKKGKKGRVMMNTLQSSIGSGKQSSVLGHPEVSSPLYGLSKVVVSNARPMQPRSDSRRQGQRALNMVDKIAATSTMRRLQMIANSSATTVKMKRSQKQRSVHTQNWQRATETAKHSGATPKSMERSKRDIAQR